MKRSTEARSTGRTVGDGSVDRCAALEAADPPDLADSVGECGGRGGLELAVEAGGESAALAVAGASVRNDKTSEELMPARPKMQVRCWVAYVGVTLSYSVAVQTVASVQVALWSAVAAAVS